MDFNRYRYGTQNKTTSDQDANIKTDIHNKWKHGELSTCINDMVKSAQKNDFQRSKGYRATHRGMVDSGPSFFFNLPKKNENFISKFVVYMKNRS